MLNFAENGDDEEEDTRSNDADGASDDEADEAADDGGNDSSDKDDSSGDGDDNSAGDATQTGNDNSPLAAADSVGANAGTGALAAPDDRQQAIRDYLARQYADASDNSDVKDARDRARRTRMIAGIAQAAEGIARARSEAVGGEGANAGFYDRMRQGAAADVQAAQQDREARIKDFLTKQQIGQQAASAQQQHDLRQQQIDAADPGSRSSQISRAAFKANFPDIANSMGDSFNSLSTSDLGKISQITDTKAKIDAAKQAAAANHELARARLDAQAGQKDKERDIAFAGKFEKAKQEHDKASAELDNQMNMIDQAAGSEGGIAGALAKGGSLHGALGRVSQGELPLASDPSIQNKLETFWNKVTTGQTITDKDVREYRKIIGAQKDNLDKSWGTRAQSLTDDNDRAARHPEGYSAALVGMDKPATKTAATPKPQPPPHGDTVTQGGVTFKWDGFKYQPQPQTAAQGGAGGGGI